MRKKILIIIGLIISYCPNSGFSQSNINITTYHPSPTGSYDRLRIFSQANETAIPACDATTRGLFYTRPDGDLRFCDGTAWMLPSKTPWVKLQNDIFLQSWNNPLAFVGIGTSTPQARLHIVKPDNNTHLLFSNDQGQGRLAIGTDSATNVLLNTLNNKDLRLGTTNAVNSIVIKTTGNVGIGKTDPQDALDVNGNVIAPPPTAANQLATKGYVDTAPTIITQSISTSACQFGGTEGTQMKVCHGPCTAANPWVTVSEVYCNAVLPQ